MPTSPGYVVGEEVLDRSINLGRPGEPFYRLRLMPDGTILAGDGKTAPTPIGGGTGTHPGLTDHDALGLATQAELDAHAGSPHGGTHPDLPAHDALGLATQVELDGHSGASAPHTGHALAGHTHPAPPPAYETVADEGTALTARRRLNFVGSIVAVTDDATNAETDVTITDPVPGHLAAPNPHPDYATDTDLSGHTGATTTAHGGIVASTDARLSDARTPLAHKASHATGGSDALAPADIGAATSGHVHPVPAGVQRRVIPIFMTNAVFTNQPSGVTEPHGIRVRPRVELGVGPTEWRMSFSQGQAGAAGSTFWAEWSTDEANWLTVVEVLPFDTIGRKATAWGAIPAGAQAGDIILRYMVAGGDGVADPSWGSVQVEVR